MELAGTLTGAAAVAALVYLLTRKRRTPVPSSAAETPGVVVVGYIA